MSDTDQGESFAVESDGGGEPGGSSSLAALGRGAKAFFDWALVVVIALVVLRNKWAAPSALGSLGITSIFVAFA